MIDAAAISELELAALLCSKLCHDVISPVGAISNGFEVLEDEKDESMREMALDIMRTNAEKASSRLQFLRLAFGAMGATGDRFPLQDAKRLTENLYHGEKATVEWRASPDSLPKDQVKLLVNLVVIAVSTIPRGGDVTVGVETGADTARFKITASGSHVSLPDTVEAIFAGSIPHEGLDARSIMGSCFVVFLTAFVCLGGRLLLVGPG